MILLSKDRTVVKIKRSQFDKPKSQKMSEPKVLFLSPNTQLTNYSSLKELFFGASEVSVNDLLLAAWEKWGEGMADKLRGNFAFAIFDEQKNLVYVARDIFGVSPVYFHSGPTELIIGYSSRIVRSLLKGPNKRDKLMIADFICGTVLENEKTFFSDIKRMKPAHWMSIEKDKLVSKKYWDISDISQTSKHDEPETVFKALLNKSVMSTFVNNKTALMLSGGLDSSAIGSLLKVNGFKGSDFPCLSLTYYETNNWGDKEHLKTMEGFLGVQLEEFSSDLHDPLSDIPYWLEVMDGPFIPHGHSVSFRLLPAAKRMGYDYILCGHGGDEVVSYGLGRLNELARANKWFALWRETRAGSGLYGDSRFRLFLKYTVHIELIKKIRQRLQHKFEPKEAFVKVSSNFLSAELVDSIDVSRYSKRSELRKISHDEQSVHKEALSSPMQSTSLEVYALCAEASGVTMALPFYDRSLVEFCLSLPSKWKLNKGRSRFILREAMKGIMPNSVRIRQDKFDFGDNFIDGLLANKDKILKHTDPKRTDLSEYVNISLLVSLRKKIDENGRSLHITEAFFLWRIAVLEIWFSIESKPIKKPNLIPYTAL